MKEQVRLTKSVCDICGNAASFTLTVPNHRKYIDVCGRHVRVDWNELQEHWLDYKRTEV